LHSLVKPYTPRHAGNHLEGRLGALVKYFLYLGGLGWVDKLVARRSAAAEEVGAKSWHQPAAPAEGVLEVVSRGRELNPRPR